MIPAFSNANVSLLKIIKIPTCTRVIDVFDFTKSWFQAALITQTRHFPLCCDPPASRDLNHIPEIQKDKLLTDVDGSQIQSYHLKEGAVTVYNSYDIGAVYIDSEFDLTKFF